MSFPDRDTDSPDPHLKLTPSPGAASSWLVRIKDPNDRSWVIQGPYEQEELRKKLEQKQFPVEAEFCASHGFWFSSSNPFWMNHFFPSDLEPTGTETEILPRHRIESRIPLPERDSGVPRWIVGLTFFLAVLAIFIVVLMGLTLGLHKN